MTCRALALADRDEAGVHDGSVEQHRARAALPFPAAFLGAGEPEILAQDVEEAAHAGHIDLGRLAVDENR